MDYMGMYAKQMRSVGSMELVIVILMIGGIYNYIQIDAIQDFLGRRSDSVETPTTTGIVVRYMKLIS